MNRNRVPTFPVAAILMLVLNDVRAHPTLEDTARDIFGKEFVYLKKVINELLLSLQKRFLKPCNNPFQNGRIYDENGNCKCPNDHPIRRDLDKSHTVCCSNDLKTCKCKHFHSYHQPTNKCYEINMKKYTIEVNGTKYCQNETNVPKKGRGCCITNAIGHKHCHCEDKCHVWKSPYYDVCAPPTPPLPPIC